MTLSLWLSLEPGYAERWLWLPYYHRNYDELRMLEWGRWLIAWTAKGQSLCPQPLETAT